MKQETGPLTNPIVGVLERLHREGDLHTPLPLASEMRKLDVHPQPDCASVAWPDTEDRGGAVGVWGTDAQKLEVADVQARPGL